MNQIIIINGFARSGKDSLALFLKQHYKRHGIKTLIVSSVEDVKLAASILGWDGTKTPENRNALSDLKDLATKYWDGPFKMMSSYIKEITNNECLIFFIREPKEIGRMVEVYPGILTILINRDNHESADNHADTNVLNYKYDCIIDNNRSLDDLSKEAEGIVLTTLKYRDRQ